MGKRKRKLITNSTRNTFTNCHRKYKLRHKDRLEPIMRAPPLAFGSLIHECLAELYSDKVIFFDNQIDDWLQDYKDRIEQAGTEVDLEKAEKLAELAKGMLLGYIERFGEDLSKWRILAVEKEFRYPLPTPCSKCRGEGCAACGKTGLGRNSPVWDYGGVIDLLIQDERGSTWIVEHKTTIESDLDAYDRDLGLNMQPRGYLWAARKICIENGWPKPTGIIYNIMRKKVPSEPETTQCKRCRGTATRKGLPCEFCNATGVGGISRSKTDTTLDKFIAALKQHPHLDVKNYEDIIMQLQARGDRFFKRVQYFVSDRDVIEWLLETHQIVRDIGATQHWYRDLSSCNVNGRRCPYRLICLEDNDMARACNFHVRDSEHPEMEIDLQEDQSDGIYTSS